MRAAFVYFFLLFVCGNIAAQSPQSRPHDDPIIQEAKSILVSSLDRSLPKVTLEFFLKYEAEGAPIQWNVRECGKNNDTQDGPHDSSTCVEADFDVNNQAVSVVVSVRTSKTGRTAVPTLISTTMTDFAGTTHHMRLRELPMMLHRPLRRGPRDVPEPGTSIGTV